MEAVSPTSLLSFLAQIPDHRSRHGREHALSAILGLACCAVLCGARGYTAIAQWAHDHDIALMHRLGFTRTPPTMHGLRKVLLALNVRAFESALSRRAEAVLGRVPAGAAGEPRALALDGKTARGSFDGLSKAVHLLSLVAHESGLTLAQAAVPGGVEEKTNEHKAALALLEGLVLRGRLVTGDAMFCRRDFCRQVVGQGGDSLVFVKDNQPTLRDDIAAAFAPAASAGLSPPATPAVG